MNTQENFISVEVGGLTYQIARFKPTPALQLASRLAKFIGPALAEAVSEAQANAVGEKIDAKKMNVGKLINALIPKFDEQVVVTLVKDLIACCSFENTELKGKGFEDHFEGKMKNLFPLLGKVVEYQFADFLSELPIGRK